MNSQTENLQIVLTEMFASKDELSLADVGLWQEKYPQFAREIIEAYTDWRDLEFFILDDEESAEADEPISENDKKFIENLLAQSHVSPVENFTDLRALAAKRGVARQDLPAKLGVSETITRKIERRSLREIPQWLEGKIGEIFRVSAESVRAFFELPATLSPAAKYKSKNAPQTQPKQTFAEAVKNDPELSDDEKRELLNRK